ncbi:hypothetical protein BB559_001901 [Furculomyces boomerangus]|uniref:Diphthamide biosynthesis protein 3 n=2 Tax=Harpellales TaxID=61421 RepID=A0A2T9YZP5_9FUNG|nr:hypothetical protein BB559_001901 [Furculomyces boomerangus]PVZ98468.1 hypothetical protein BB558_005528 [Smittium angustum]PWA02345.1 hypothetical protein BB558_001515 [Smittium angustum]
MSVYDEVEIEDMEFDEDLGIYSYPCPCGDKFQITLEELYSGEDVAKCPSCSLLLRVIYEPEDFCESDEEEIRIDDSIKL